MNKVFLIGRMTKDPEIRANDKGTSKTSFYVAINRLKEGVDFISCVAWNKQAELIGKYLHKGNQIALEGHIQTGSYDDKEGKKVYTTDVVVDNITFIGSNTKIEEPKSEAKEQPKEKDPFEDFANEVELTDEDLPF